MTQPNSTLLITKGPDVIVEDVRGSQNTKYSSEDIAIGIQMSVPIEEGSLFFPGVPS